MITFQQRRNKMSEIIAIEDAKIHIRERELANDKKIEV